MGEKYEREGNEVGFLNWYHVILLGIKATGNGGKKSSPTC